VAHFASAALTFIPEQRTPLLLGIVSLALLLVFYVVRMYWGQRPKIAPVTAEANHYSEL